MDPRNEMRYSGPPPPQYQRHQPPPPPQYHHQHHQQPPPPPMGVPYEQDGDDRRRRSGGYENYDYYDGAPRIHGNSLTLTSSRESRTRFYVLGKQSQQSGISNANRATSRRREDDSNNTVAAASAAAAAPQRPRLVIGESRAQQRSFVIGNDDDQDRSQQGRVGMYPYREMPPPPQGWARGGPPSRELPPPAMPPPPHHPHQPHHHYDPYRREMPSGGGGGGGGGTRMMHNTNMPPPPRPHHTSIGGEGFPRPSHHHQKTHEKRPLMEERAEAQSASAPAVPPEAPTEEEISKQQQEEEEKAEDAGRCSEGKDSQEEGESSKDPMYDHALLLASVSVMAHTEAKASKEKEDAGNTVAAASNEGVEQDNKYEEEDAKKNEGGQQEMKDEEEDANEREEEKEYEQQQQQQQEKQDGDVDMYKTPDNSPPETPDGSPPRLKRNGSSRDAYYEEQEGSAERQSPQEPKEQEQVGAEASDYSSSSPKTPSSSSSSNNNKVAELSGLFNAAYERTCKEGTSSSAASSDTKKECVRSKDESDVQLVGVRRAPPRGTVTPSYARHEQVIERAAMPRRRQLIHPGSPSPLPDPYGGIARRRSSGGQPYGRQRQEDYYIPMKESSPQWAYATSSRLEREEAGVPREEHRYHESHCRVPDFYETDRCPQQPVLSASTYDESRERSNSEGAGGRSPPREGSAVLPRRPPPGEGYYVDHAYPEPTLPPPPRWMGDGRPSPPPPPHSRPHQFWDYPGPHPPPPQHRGGDYPYYHERYQGRSPPRSRPLPQEQQGAGRWRESPPSPAGGPPPTHIPPPMPRHARSSRGYGGGCGGGGPNPPPMMPSSLNDAPRPSPPPPPPHHRVSFNHDIRLVTGAAASHPPPRDIREMTGGRQLIPSSPYQERYRHHHPESSSSRGAAASDGPPSSHHRPCRTPDRPHAVKSGLQKAMVTPEPSKPTISTDPRTPPTPPRGDMIPKISGRTGKVIISKGKWAWKDYPELEAFLIANRDEYLRHSAMNYTAQQKDFNNRLTERLLEVAERHDYVFDRGDFNFVSIRDRIRCYYKSYVQSNKKRGIIVSYPPMGPRKKARVTAAGGGGGPGSGSSWGGVVPVRPKPTEATSAAAAAALNAAE